MNCSGRHFSPPQGNFNSVWIEYILFIHMSSWELLHSVLFPTLKPDTCPLLSSLPWNLTPDPWHLIFTCPHERFFPPGIMIFNKFAAQLWNIVPLFGAVINQPIFFCILYANYAPSSKRIGYYQIIVKITIYWWKLDKNILTHSLCQTITPAFVEK